MATLKQRVHRKNSSGSYDTIHYETSASCVLASDGTTVENWLNWLHNRISTLENSSSGGQITILSRVGTGNSAEASLTCEFPMKMILCIGYMANSGYTYIAEGSMGSWFINLDLISTDNTYGHGFALDATGGRYTTQYVCSRRSNDYKTVCWYHSQGDSYGANYSNQTYYFLAIGR